jgi:hypothetical protein
MTCVFYGFVKREKRDVHDQPVDRIREQRRGLDIILLAATRLTGKIKEQCPNARKKMKVGSWLSDVNDLQAMIVRFCAAEAKVSCALYPALRFCDIVRELMTSKPPKRDESVHLRPPSLLIALEM